MYLHMNMTLHIQEQTNHENHETLSQSLGNRGFENAWGRVRLGVSRSLGKSGFAIVNPEVRNG